MNLAMKGSLGYLNAFGSVVEVDWMIPGAKGIAQIRMSNVRLSCLKARQASPVTTALYAEATRNAWPEAFRPGELPDEVDLSIRVLD